MTRRSRRVLAFSLGGVAVVGLLVGGYLVADQIVRGEIEARIGEKLVEQLPENITADPLVTLGGGSAIAQYFSGTLDAVTVEADPLTIDGVPLSAQVELLGIPTNPEAPVQELHATAVIDQSALDAWTAAAGVLDPVQIGVGTIGYDGMLSLFAFEIGYHVTVEPVLAGPWIELKPTTATVTSGSLELDVKQLLGALGEQELRICSAEYLPAQMTLSEIRLQPGTATVQLDAADVVLAELDGATGTCP